MLLRTLAVVLPLVALAPQTQDAPLRSLLPLPKKSIALASTKENPLTLDVLLTRLSEETGVTFSCETVVRNLLLRQRVEISQSVELAPEQAYPWIEGLLVQNGYQLGILNIEAKPLVGVYPMFRQSGPSADPVSHFVPIERIGECRVHPALMVTTVIDMGPNIDARTLGNSLRGLTGNDQFASIMPVANLNSVIVKGFGLSVVNLADLLATTRQQADDAAKVREK
jgi:hypothetical protein